MYKNFKAEWTGSYPCLCSGEWILTAETTEYDEERGKYSVVEDISHLIPADLRKSPMFCEGMYDMWSFDEDHIEKWDTYKSGLNWSAWVQNNESWISLFATPEQYIEVFKAFQKNDWRHNSCGGCI